jgi:acetate---CoA ligase (ADP-forming)
MPTRSAAGRSATCKIRLQGPRLSGQSRPRHRAGADRVPSVEALPEAPDAAIIAVPGQGAVDAIEACAARGVKAAVVMASGFGELGAEGKAEEARLRKLANAAGMRLVGPNSQGLANFGTGAILSFSTMFIEAPPQDGPVACISQSGAMSVVPYGLLRERGIGLRHVHATGNDCDVTVSELAAAVIQDPDVKLLLLYLETLTDPAALAHAAALGRARGVPIIAVKSGRSEDGRRAAASHTGAIATADRVVDAFFERHGIWRADGMLDLVARPNSTSRAGNRPGAAWRSSATAAPPACWPPTRPNGRVCRWRNWRPRPRPPCARSCPASPRPATRSTSPPHFEQQRAVRPGPAGGGRRPESVDLFLIGLPVSGRGYDYPRFAADTAAFMNSSGKPVVLAAPQPKVRAAFADLGVPVFATEDEAVTALAQFVGHHEMLEASQGGPVPAPAPAPEGPHRFLDEHRSLELLEAHGMPDRRAPAVPRRRGGRRLPGRTRRPIVLKACSGELPHKSEHGLVRLGLGEPHEVEAAFAEIAAKLDSLGVGFEGILAARMASGERELVVGGRIDPVFGPVVMLGDGGVLVEAMPDSILLLPPFDAAAVRRALGRLRIAPLFAGVRGRPPLDWGAVARAAQAVAALLEAEAGRVRSVDVNPLLVSRDGALALDALVEVAGEVE